MKAPLLAFFLAGIVLCSFAPSKTKESALSNKERIQQLHARIEKIIKMADPNINVGIEVVSLQSGQVIYEKNAQRLFLPADSVKMITAAAALDLLGPHYQFSTSLFTDGSIQSHVLKGNLYLKGGGDPTLRAEDLESLAFLLKAQGVHEVQGELFLDLSDFDSISQGPGWMTTEAIELGATPLSALLVNHNRVDIWVCPSEEASKVYMVPQTDHIVLENESQIMNTAPETIQVYRKGDSNTILIQGTLPEKNSPLAYTVPMAQPTSYAGSLFKTALEKQGLIFKPTISEKKAPSHALLLASHTSEALSVLIRTMILESDHLYADCFFKKMGQAQTPGSWQTGSQAVRTFLKNRLGIETEEMVILDGSGLSRYNLLSAQHLTQVLSKMKTQFSYGSEFVASFPLNGSEGAMKYRMQEDWMQSKVRASIGSLQGASSFCGYLITERGEELAFAILINGFAKPPSIYKANLEDEICRALVQY